MRPDKAVLVATNGVFFVFLNFVKLPPYAMPCQLDWSKLVTSLLRAPPVPVGVSPGMWLSGRGGYDQFYWIGQICIFFSDSKLLCDGLRNPGVI